jgi:hypothetical protein
LRRQGKRATATSDSPHADTLSQEAIAARTAARARVARGGLAAMVLQTLTALMWLDIVLFGRFRTGPYFLLLRKRSD